MRTAWAVALGTGVVMAMAGPAAGQEVQRLPGDDVAIYNLAGQVRVVRGTGSDVTVRVTRGGADAANLSIETGEISGRQTLRIRYPGDEVVYPRMGRGSNTSLRVRADGTFSDDDDRGRGDRVEVRGSGGGLEAWADLVVEVPGGTAIAVYLAVGEAEATGLESDLLIDTGSGEVTATDITGALNVDTGSGGVRVQGVRGEVSVDTGSGQVNVTDVAGGAVRLDTGSGGITAAGVQADMLDADTGSGSVRLSRVTSPQVRVDTGSGSVDVELLADVEVLSIDTGSGGVTVRVPESFGANVEMETGSGGIDLDFPIEVRRVERNHLVGQIGDGAGEIEIDTGSGSIRFMRSGN